MDQIEGLEATAKATEEVAKTAGKLIDGVRESGNFIAQIIKEPLKEFSGLITDKIRFKRQENLLDLEQRLQKKIAASGKRYVFREPSLSISIPLLEAASLEESKEILELWANLALNFSNSKNNELPQKSFITVLREMSILDAKIFQKIYSTPQADEKCLLTAKLPEKVDFYIEIPTGERKEPDPPSPEVQIALSNLFRLQCLQTAKYMGGPDVYYTVYTTPFGRSLFQACSFI